ncbi:hypothetical protein FPQ18DRAFT_391551 [Pyronema domesticum]|nr:hypothetical protein FPQ18DRAFT_391551 [Pyronema domesticum]
MVAGEITTPRTLTTNSPTDSYYSGAPHLGDLNFPGPYHPTTYENLYSDTNPGPRYLRIFKTINGVTEVLPNNEWVYPFDNGTNNPTSSPTLAATATSILPAGLPAPIPTHAASVPFAAPSQGPAMVAESLNPSYQQQEEHEPAKRRVRKTGDNETLSSISCRRVTEQRGNGGAMENRIRKALEAAEDVGLVMEWVKKGM